MFGKTTKISLWLGVLVSVALAACQPQPAAPPTAQPTAAPPLAGGVEVETVEAQIGYGSPIPLDILITGRLPNTCAQIAQITQERQGDRIDVRLTASEPAGENCVQDSVPFRTSVHVNTPGLPVGRYTVTVNGVSAPFELPAQLPQDALVSAVEISILESFPVQVHATVRGDLPNACWRVDSVVQTRDGNIFRLIPLVTREAEAACAEVITPWEQVVALDAQGLLAGGYTVVVDEAKVADLPGGQYSLLVLGPSATFTLDMENTPIETPSAGLGSINGWLWHDLCASGTPGQPAPETAPAGCQETPGLPGTYLANGLIAPDETPIGGVVVRLGEGACPSAGLAETTTVATDLSYSFLGLKAGTYCVSIDPLEAGNVEVLVPGGWTYPAIADGPAAVTLDLGSGENKFDVNFGWDYQFLP